jgi:tRNA modification GTPase
MVAETIFALASGAGRAGVAVFRLSGPAAGSALEALSRRPLPSPRRATRVRLADPAGELLDDGLALWFPAPASFTGEDVVELHTHGGRAVIAAVSDALVGLGLRPAEPGEFSRRAFHNGKLDLTAAEAIADLVDAETAAQRRQALRQLDGDLAALTDRWRDALLRALAWFEAQIDFPEDDLPPEVMDQVWAAVAALRDELAAHLAEAPRGERLRQGLQVAILGAPNVGKSSLLNRLARRDAAIVSAKAGTTRDVVEVHLDLGGYPVQLADTAGLREAAEDIEEEGIRRALARWQSADLGIVVFDGAALPDLDPATLGLLDDRSLVVVNKADLAGALPAAIGGHAIIAVSATTGQGVEHLEAAVAAAAAELLSQGTAPVPTRARHRSALAECLAALDRSRIAPLPELAAEDLRLAARALGRITGRVDVEDLLDVIFRDFCIGK